MMLSIKVDTGNTGIHTCRDGNDEIFALMYNLHRDENTEEQNTGSNAEATPPGIVGVLYDSETTQ
jgi:hypothetical protein